MNDLITKSIGSTSKSIGEKETISRKEGQTMSLRNSQEGEKNATSIKIKMEEMKQLIRSQITSSKLNSTIEDLPYLDELNTTHKGVHNRSIYPSMRKHVENLILINNIFNNSNNGLRKSNQLGRFVRFKAVSENSKKSLTSMTMGFAKLAFSSALKEMRPPSQKEIIEKLLSNPDTKKMIEQALKDKRNKVVYSNEIHGNYEVISKRTSITTVDPNSKYS